MLLNIQKFNHLLDKNKILIKLYLLILPRNFLSSYETQEFEMHFDAFCSIESYVNSHTYTIHYNYIPCVYIDCNSKTCKLLDLDYKYVAIVGLNKSKPTEKSIYYYNIVYDNWYVNTFQKFLRTRV